MGTRSILALWISWALYGFACAQAPTISFLPGAPAGPASEKQPARLGLPISDQSDMLPLTLPEQPTPRAGEPISQRRSRPGLGLVPIQYSPDSSGVDPPGILAGLTVETVTTLPRPLDDGSTRCYPNPLFENLAFQFAIDTSKEPVDLGINSNFGFRAAFNWGLPLDEDTGIGVQVGSALNYSQNALRILRMAGGPSDRLQNFTTLGIFRRSESGWNYGIAYDFRFDDYYTEIDTSQWRAQISKYISDYNEVGVFGAWRDRIDQGVVAGIPVTMRPMNQVALFWRHLWENDIVTRVWVGVAEEHGRFQLLKPGDTITNHPFAFGADFHVPLTNCLALFGEAHFITPNDTGTVTATVGLAWYPGGGARTTTRSRFAPLFPLANNPYFALDLQ